MKTSKKIPNLKGERWKKIETSHPTRKCDYYVSNFGRIKSKTKASGKGYLLKGSKMKTGYYQLVLMLKDDIRANLYVHRLVAENFKSNKNPKRIFVTHLDGNKQNNIASNLKWVTKDELYKHHVKLGSYKYDREKHKMGSHVKMTEAKVRTLKKRLKTGRMTRTQLAQKFGITMTQIKRIARGENWGHVTID